MLQKQFCKAWAARGFDALAPDAVALRKKGQDVVAADATLRDVVSGPETVFEVVLAAAV